jgi:hypothetical protein
MCAHVHERYARAHICVADDPSKNDCSRERACALSKLSLHHAGRTLSFETSDHSTWLYWLALRKEELCELCILILNMKGAILKQDRILLS